jgi:hypothetical protein
MITEPDPTLRLATLEPQDERELDKVARCTTQQDYDLPGDRRRTKVVDRTFVDGGMHAGLVVFAVDVRPEYDVAR